LLTLIIGITCEQDPDPGVLVEFGCHRGDPVVERDVAGRPQSINHSLGHVDAESNPLVVDRRRETRHPQLVRRLHPGAKAIDGRCAITLSRFDSRAVDIPRHQAVDAAALGSELIALVEKPHRFGELTGLVQHLAEKRAGKPRSV
jgi:hypothetical protein